MIDIPDDKPPWRAGYEARRASKSRDENPFDVRDARLLLWDDGWLFADTEITRTPIQLTKHVSEEKPTR